MIDSTVDEEGLHQELVVPTGGLVDVVSGTHQGLVVGLFPAEDVEGVVSGTHQGLVVG